MSIRRLLAASAAVLALAGVARAGDVTYPMLNNQTTVQDADLLAVWRASGPLAKANASVLAAYLQAKFNADYLQIGNNLSDLGNLTTARSNLGLGSAALANTGTSGTAICQLNANCTWGGTETFNAAVTMGSTLSITGALTANVGANFGDSQFYAALQSGNPVLNFNPNAFVSFNRSSSSLALSTALGKVVSIDSGGNLAATGNITASNGIVASPNGTGPAVDATGPGSGSTGGVRVRAGATGDAIIQFTNNGSPSLSQWGYFDVASSGVASWNGGVFSAPGGFSGNITGTTASFSGASSFGSTLGVTGLATFNGGISDTGNLSVSGTTTDTGLVTMNGGLTVAGGTTTFTGNAFVNGASGSQPGFVLRSGGVNRWDFYLNGSDGGSNTGSDLCLNNYDNSGTGIGTPLCISRATGLVTVNNGLTVTNGLTVSGALTLPAASVINADLDTVNSSSGSCGSATATCTFTTNAQGRITAQGSATIQPDTCSSGVNGYCKNAEGIITQWGVYDCGSSACWSSTATITINLPTTCPNGFFSTQATGYNPGGVSSPRTPTIVGVGGSPVNQLYVRGDGASDEGFYWTLICH